MCPFAVIGMTGKVMKTRIAMRSVQSRMCKIGSRKQGVAWPSKLLIVVHNMSFW